MPNSKPRLAASSLIVLLCAVGAWYATSVLTGMVSHQISGLVSVPQAWHVWQSLSWGDKTFKLVLLVSCTLALIIAVSMIAALYTERRSIHGDARFATAADLERAGLFAKSGIILAKLGAKYLVFGGQEFVMVAAPTRSGKGVGIVIPNLLNWQDSATVMDVKLENWLLTSGWRQSALGQKVYLFNPFDAQGKTHRWNPLDAVSRDPVLSVADVLQIAQIFYPSAAGDKNRFFQDTAQSLFMGIALYLIETRHPRTTIGEVLRQGTGYGKPLVEHLAEILEHNPNLSNACRNALQRVTTSNGETFSNIKATFDAALLMFAIPTLDWATSASDFDLTQVRREKMTIYLGIPVDKLKLAERLLNLYFTQLINLNTRTLPEDDATLKHQCLLINDEFTAAGRLDVLLTSAAFIAGYNLRLLTVIQSTSQLKNPSLYGREGAETLLANHAVRVIFPPSTMEEAKDYSEMLGTYTMDVTSHSRSGKGMAMLTPASLGQSTSSQRRALLMPQELRNLDKSVAIVLKPGVEPAMCKKAFYYTDHIFLHRLGEISQPFARHLQRSRSPSQAQLTALRAKGGFAATVATAHFSPFTHNSVTQTPPAITPQQPQLAPELLAAITQAANAMAERIPHVSEFADESDWIEAVMNEGFASFLPIYEKAV